MKWALTYGVTSVLPPPILLFTNTYGCISINLCVYVPKKKIYAATNSTSVTSVLNSILLELYTVKFVFLGLLVYRTSSASRVRTFMQRRTRPEAVLGEGTTSTIRSSDACAPRRESAPSSLEMSASPLAKGHVEWKTCYFRGRVEGHGRGYDAEGDAS
jgi:hypothetical protein